MVTVNIDGAYNVTGTNDATVYCKSTDEKPTDDTIINGYACMEIDTGDVYIFDGDTRTWVKI